MGVVTLGQFTVGDIVQNIRGERRTGKIVHLYVGKNTSMQMAYVVWEGRKTFAAIPIDSLEQAKGG